MEVSESTASTLAKATAVSIFNERDASKRRQLMEQHWSPNITCYEPGRSGSGYDSLEETWQNIHAGDMEDFDFRMVGQVWLNHNLIHVGWEYGPGGEAGEKGLRGSDIMIVGTDGKVEVLYAMIEGACTVQ